MIVKVVNDAAIIFFFNRTTRNFSISLLMAHNDNITRLI